ncbi:MAG TPA: 4'-phosphopantetheinyl transferase superfamily protein [Methylomirabilota bacterium]|nr:4'-phosphopantetheinyl transferase superfamily protein [Methylomirabilota bacterium]
MNSDAAHPGRCGIDTVEVARIAKLLDHAGPGELSGFFTAQELADAGSGPGRAASLAARFAAKEACAKLFPRELALGALEPMDFSVRRDPYGAPLVEVSARARAVLDRHLVAGLRVSLTHTGTIATAVAWAEPRSIEVPWFGRLLYHVLPYRRGVVMANLRRVFGDTVAPACLERLAQAYYAHYTRFLLEFLRLPFQSAARREASVRVENIESPLRAHAQGKGVLILTGHFGNFEVATVAGIGKFPQYRGLLHFVRRQLKPRLLNDFVTWRFRRAGFGTLPKRGSLDTILELLGRGALIVFVFDQHAGRPDGIPVEFFGHPAGTFKSLAVIALATGAPVIPAASWRESDGTHVLRFEEPLPLIECEDAGEAIRRNTRAYNAALERMLLRHPEQWIWMHRRWKLEAARKI